MDAKERIEILRNQFQVKVIPHKYGGGQQCGLLPPTVVGIHEELGIEIRIKYHRSMHNNKELVETVFNLMFDELIK